MKDFEIFIQIKVLESRVVVYKFSFYLPYFYLLVKTAFLSKPAFIFTILSFLPILSWIYLGEQISEKYSIKYLELE